MKQKSKSAKAEKKQCRRRPVPDLETLRNAELVPVGFFPSIEPGFTEGSLRWLLFNRDDNGLSKSGAVVKLGRRVFIVPKRFRAWAHAGNK
jgi:hypothetical protein